MAQARDSLQAYVTAVFFNQDHSATWTDLGLLYESCDQLVWVYMYIHSVGNSSIYHKHCDIHITWFRSANIAVRVRNMGPNTVDNETEHYDI